MLIIGQNGASSSPASVWQFRLKEPSLMSATAQADIAWLASAEAAQWLSSVGPAETELAALKRLRKLVSFKNLLRRLRDDL